MGRVADGTVARLDDSELGFSSSRLEPHTARALAEADADSLLYVVAGEGALELDGSHPLGPGTAALALAGEEAQVRAADAGLTVVVATVGAGAHRHAPLGERRVVEPAASDAASAAGARSYRVLLGPHNGSLRATLFLGFIPPGKAPWHYHLYDEIVWVPEGPGRLHLEGSETPLEAGSAFRLRPRQVHIVENASADREMAVVGVFTPAGSPSAAYLPR
jgi:quercetin dioxygenase-like cupin family protein